MVLKDGWRFFILAFMDVEGNYFIVLAYRYVSPRFHPLTKQYIEVNADKIPRQRS